MVRKSSPAETQDHLNDDPQSLDKGPALSTQPDRATAELLPGESTQELQRGILANLPQQERILDKSRAQIAAREGIDHETFWGEVEAVE